MTVSTEVDHNDYIGNGVTTVFPYQFRIFKAADLTVVTVDLNENQRELILGTDYTVTGAGSYQGGNVILVSALVSGWKISIARELPVTQDTDLRNQGKFFAEVHENAFDKLTMLIQQAYSIFRLALRKPSSIANWYDALNNYIRNLRDPRDPQDAATKNYVDTQVSDNTAGWHAGDAALNQKIDANFSKTLRVPEAFINQVPQVSQRANKLLAFDNLGNVATVLPESGSASDVLLELLNQGDKKIGSTYGGTVYSDYRPYKFKKVGYFATGFIITNSEQAIYYSVTGHWYSYTGTIPVGGLVVPPASTPDTNWKSVGNLNGYAYNHFLNFKNELVTDEQALTAAFNTGYEVDLSGAVATTTVDYTIPAGSKGLKGGTLMLGGRLSTVPYDFGPASLFGSSYRAGVSVIRLDGTDRTGQLIKIDNGYTFCIDDALASGVTPDSIDGFALTRELNSYQSQYIQVVRVIGHTSGGEAILSEPLVVNIVAGRAKWQQCIGNLTPFHLYKVSVIPTSGTRRTLWLSQVDLVIEHCYFKDCTVEMHYGCYNSRFIHNDVDITTKLMLDNDQPRISFSIQSSVAEIAHNKISSTGVGDSDIAVYKQIAYVNVHDNQVSSPIIGNTWYTPDHWSIYFHSAVYHCQAHNNNTSSKTGIGAFVFCDDIQISNNLIKCNVLISAFCHTVLYIDNSIISEGSSSFIGNTRLVVNGGQWNIREGGQRSGLILSPSAKPFNADGFKVIDSSVLSVDGTYFYSTSKNPYLNPKTLMTAPTSGSDTVFPLNNAHLANQSVGIHMSNVKLDFVEVKNCTFQNLNYGINMYRSISALGQVRVEFSNNDFTCDAGICMRGTSGFRHYAGNISDNTFGADCLYGVINANIQGVGIVNCKFMSFGGSGVLVASASNTALQCVMATNCSFDGVGGSGFKYYDFNGYIGSYSLSPTQAGCNFLPHGLWFYQPSENILTSSGTGVEYCSSVYFNGSSFVGAILKKQNTITTIP